MRFCIKVLDFNLKNYTNSKQTESLFNFKKFSCRARAGYALSTNRQTHSDVFAGTGIKSERPTQHWQGPERLARREFGEAMLVTTALSAASRTVLCASGGEDWQSERGVPIKTNGAVNNGTFVQ